MVEIRSAVHNIRRNHEAHTVPQYLPSSGRSPPLWAAAAPGWQVCPVHHRGSPLERGCRMYPHNTEPDTEPVSWARSSSHHTWTYGPHYKWPSPEPALTYPQCRSPCLRSGWQCPSKSGCAPVPVRFHMSRPGPWYHGRYPENEWIPTPLCPPPAAWCQVLLPAGQHSHRSC